MIDTCASVQSVLYSFGVPITRSPDHGDLSRLAVDHPILRLNAILLGHAIGKHI
jgi:hypothetical protein